MSDLLDDLLTHWAAEAPGLDTPALGNTSRLLRLARALEKKLDHALAPLGLTLWQFEVLSALIAAPPAEGAHACQLLPACQLSPAAMTNRLDRLEQAGWIHRLPDPDDRRATRVHLTPDGRALVRQALRAIDHAACPLSPAESTQLDHILRKLLASLCNQIDPDSIS